MNELEQSLIEAERILQNWCYSKRYSSSIEDQDRSNKRDYQNRLRLKLGIEKPYHYYYNGVDYQRNELKWLRIALDKLQLANNSSRSRCFKLSSSVKVVDHHSLHFGLLHGIKNLSEEKKILQKLKEVEKDSSSQCRTFREDDKMSITYTDEEEIRSCAVNGNKWRSLGSKHDILKDIKSLIEHYGNEEPVLLKKKLAVVETELRSLGKNWINVWELRAEARTCLSHLKQQTSNIKAKETLLLNKTSNFISSVKEKPRSLKNIKKAFLPLQRQV